MRIRSVKPDFWRDEVTGLMEPDLALFYIGMACYADDYGRFVWSTTLIHADLDPFSKKWGGLDGIERMLTALVESKRVVKYCVDGRYYGFIPSQRKHQKPNRPTPSKIPPPPSGLTEGSVSAHGGLSEDSLREWSGEERNGDASTFWLTPEMAPPEPPPDPVVLRIPCRGVKDDPDQPDLYPVKASQVSEWQEMFPSVNVPLTLKQAAGWINAKPDQRKKTFRGMPEFCRRWLSTAENRSSRFPAAQTRPPSKEDLLEQQAQERFNAAVARTKRTSNHHAASAGGDGGPPRTDGEDRRPVPEASGANPSTARSVLGNRWASRLLQDSFSVEHGDERGEVGTPGPVREPGDVPGSAGPGGAVEAEPDPASQDRGPLHPGREKDVG